MASVNIARHETSCIHSSEAVETVDRLMADLRAALVACGQGPLRVTIDSDGHGIVQSLAGRPIINGQRLVGVPPLLLRTIVGPERQPRDIDVQAA